jgi:hypothetical protein
MHLKICPCQTLFPLQRKGDNGTYSHPGQQSLTGRKMSVKMNTIKKKKKKKKKYPDFLCSTNFKLFSQIKLNSVHDDYF